jgi:uncharacterized protein YndB with AHSA1/START domain
MTRIEHSVIIQAPIEKVFSYTADYQKWSEWFEGVSDFRATTTVSQGNGARYAYKARMMGVSAKIETEIHDFQLNRGWKGVATKGMPHLTQWIFEPITEGTKFTYILEYDMPIPLLCSLLDSLFMKPKWTKILEKSLNNLKHHFIMLKTDKST